MPAKFQSAAARQIAGLGADGQLVIDRATHTIKLTREFSAPRELVFDAWTRPQDVALWWDPSGARLAECEIDLHPGGAFKFVPQGANGAPPFAGIYREIDRPGRLTFEALGATGKVVLEEAGGRTLLTVSIVCSSKDHLDTFLSHGVDVGTSQTLDNLVAFVAEKWS